jgi:hypothetical protein
MRDEVFCRLCLLLQDTLFTCRVQTELQRELKSRGLTEASTQRKDANYVIERALISSPDFYVILCNF